VDSALFDPTYGQRAQGEPRWTRLVLGRRRARWRRATPTGGTRAERAGDGDPEVSILSGCFQRERPARRGRHSRRRLSHGKPVRVIGSAHVVLEPSPSTQHMRILNQRPLSLSLCVFGTGSAKRSAMPSSMGMLQVSGTTYRIDRSGNEYAIVRLLDDVTIGSFHAAGGRVFVRSSNTTELLVARIARAAVRHGRTIWQRPAARQPPRRATWLPPKLAVLASFLWR
jgi:hypothetical protein